MCGSETVVLEQASASPKNYYKCNWGGAHLRSTKSEILIMETCNLYLMNPPDECNAV
jgi:hypothetical protein